MKIILFGTRKVEKVNFEKIKSNDMQIKYIDEPLSKSNVNMCKGYEYISTSIECDGSKDILNLLSNLGIKYWLQRSAGFENIDINEAKKLKIGVYRVPAYSPESIAEHALTLMLAANRTLKKQILRVMKQNFYIEDLIGECINKKTIGVLGSGKIGQCFIKAVSGLGVEIIVCDEFQQKNNPNLAKELNFKFVTKNELFMKSDFISLHAPLLDSTKHIVNHKTLSLMKKDAIIVNTARGKLINTSDLLVAINKGIIRGAGLDVYEFEDKWFFKDCSTKTINDKVLKEIILHPKIILTSHSAYMTNIALFEIVKTTMDNALIASADKHEWTRLA